MKQRILKKYKNLFDKYCDFKQIEIGLRYKTESISEIEKKLLDEVVVKKFAILNEMGRVLNEL